MPTGTGAAVPRIVQPAKRLASNSLQVKASDKKVTTILSPILMALPQSSSSTGVCTVTKAQLDGTERAPSAESAKATLHDHNMSLQGPSCTVGLEVNASVQPPLVTESHARMTKSKFSDRGASLKKDELKTNEPANQGKDGAGTNAARRDSLVADPSRIVGPEGQALQSRPSVSLGEEETDQAGKSVHLAQVEPAVTVHWFAHGDGSSGRNHDSCPDNSLGYHEAKEWKEAAST